MPRFSYMFHDCPATRRELVRRLSARLCTCFLTAGVTPAAAIAAGSWIATDARLFFDLVRGRTWLLFAEGDKFLPRLFGSKTAAVAECRRMLGREPESPQVVAVAPLLPANLSSRWVATCREAL